VLFCDWITWFSILLFVKCETNIDSELVSHVVVKNFSNLIIAFQFLPWISLSHLILVLYFFAILLWPWLSWSIKGEKWKKAWNKKWKDKQTEILFISIQWNPFGLFSSPFQRRHLLYSVDRGRIHKTSYVQEFA
jgi:hypothetical protein